MTRKVRFLIWLSQFFTFNVMHVESARIGDKITEALYLFGKQVWVEKDLTHARSMYVTEPKEEDLRWYGSTSGAFQATTPAHACEVASRYGIPGPFSGPFDTLQEAEKKK